MDQIEIKPLTGRINAEVRVPGSKSITNRALLIAAMAPGRSELEGALFSDDTRYMIGALERLGFVVEADQAREHIAVEGRGGEIPAHSADLFVGGAGTAMRFLAGFVTLGRGRFRLDGNARMRERPIGELIEALDELGISARTELGNRCPPVVIDMSSGAFEGGSCAIDASRSSQFVSALLLPAPLWPKGLTLKVSGAAGRPFVDMTLKLMGVWGANSRAEGDAIVVSGGQSYAARRFTIEGDASGASYFAAAAALCGGSVRFANLATDSVQGDAAFMDLLETMGAKLIRRRDSLEIRGDGKFCGVDADMSTMPDVVPTLATIAPFAESPTRIRNVAFIRHHESDRLHALATELCRLGAKVDESEDGLLIQPSKLKPAAIETYDDHRIAMAFAVVGLKLPGVRITNPGCVAKTYPDFFKDLAALG
ncbi:MAG TPA: 3-phosphoshikimate 1-carboxyvinyltransferase [Candidatus Binataceae bacterium]|nr:3-phosphoshikimate 1-carboxyvinyltransferase [Candidatus Binataceae bacterium]